MRKLFKISVRNLVELVMRHGSIDNRYMSNAKAIEGIIGHQKVQNSYGDNYEKEVIVKHQLAYEDIDIQIEGRIDGILKEEDKYIIDEIKTTTKNYCLLMRIITRYILHKLSVMGIFFVMIIIYLR